jgi:pimeloyl-ACP methyl ester carboxylesterase
MSEIAETQYAKTHDGVHIAYQTLGDGPRDVVLWPEWITNCEVLWEQPVFHTALHRTASFARVIFFDKRGIGLSDRVAASEVPSLETWVDDLKTILEAVGSDRPVLLSLGHGGVLAMLFAATYPERVGGLILINSYARLIQGPGYPYGYPPEVEDYVVSKTEAEWGATGWGEDHWYQCGLSGEPAFAEIAAFLGIESQSAEIDGTLATLVFCDVVQSTDLVHQMGDRRWHDILDRRSCRPPGGSFPGPSCESRPGTAISPRSTAQDAESAVRRSSSTEHRRSGSRCDVASTRGRWRCAATTSPGLLCIWLSGLSRRQDQVRS